MLINPGFRETKLTKEVWRKEYYEYRKAWEENPKKGIVGRFPLNLDMELTRSCNLRCPPCPREYIKKKSGNMDRNLVLKILNEVRGQVPAFKFNWLGEPMMNFELPWAIKKAKDGGAIDTAINTNGTLLTMRYGKALIEAGLDRLIVSIDSIDPKTYESIRVGAFFKPVIKNIENFLKIRAYFGTDKPYVRVQKIDLPEHSHENKAFIKFFTEMGVDSVAINTYKQKDMKQVDWEPMPCAQVWQRMMVAFDGEIFPCCQGHNFEPIGNAKSMSIEDAWNSERMNMLRNFHSTNRQRLIDQCRHCEVTRPG